MQGAASGILLMFFSINSCCSELRGDFSFFIEWVFSAKKVPAKKRSAFIILSLIS